MTEDSIPLSGRHRNVALALEKEGTQTLLDGIPMRFQQVDRHVGRQEAHAAADVVARGLRKDDVSRLDDSTHRDARSLVKIGRQDDLFDRRAHVTEETGIETIDVVDSSSCIRQAEKLLESIALDVDILVSDELDVDARMIDLGDRVRETLQEGKFHFVSSLGW